MVELATGRYADGEAIKASGLVAVATSVTLPKFPLDYPLVWLPEAAPFGLLAVKDDTDFAKGYRRGLELIGVEAFRQRFRDLSEDHNGRGLGLLCYEQVVGPDTKQCHRRVFAAWWGERAGQEIPELPPSQPGLW